MPLFKFSESVQESISFNFTSSGYVAPVGNNVDFSLSLGIVTIDAQPFEYYLELFGEIGVPYEYIDAKPFEYFFELSVGELYFSGWSGILLEVYITGPEKIFGIEAVKLKDIEII